MPTFHKHESTLLMSHVPNWENTFSTVGFSEFLFKNSIYLIAYILFYFPNGPTQDLEAEKSGQFLCWPKLKSKSEADSSFELYHSWYRASIRKLQVFMMRRRISHRGRGPRTSVITEVLCLSDFVVLCILLCSLIYFIQFMEICSVRR